MIINHNISALNAQRHFNLNVKEMDENLEALSSGLRINKGADDAAGLAVSEKMRAQIRGLYQASRNIQDGYSLIQTAEGFLHESNEVLQRMRELVVQAANGTYTQEDRAQITVEIDEMIKELNRVHEDAKFNTMRLLDGKSVGLNSFGYAGMGTAGDDTNTTALGPQDILLARNPNFNLPDNSAGRNSVVIQSGANTDERMIIQMDAFNSYALGLTDVPGGTGNEIRYSDVATTAEPSTNQNLAWREKSFYTPQELNLDSALYLEAPIQPPASGVTINLLPPIDGNRVNVSTSESSTESIAVMDVALNKVNKQRADLGAFQNRLEMAQKGVDIAAENLQSAESRIRDADMAKQYIMFTKNQILSQSAASMTAQANLRSQLIFNVIS